MTTEPTKEEIKEALEAIHRLCVFEADTRHIRGYGGFKIEELPIPGLVKLCAWLKEKSE